MDGAAASHHRAPEADASSHHAYEGPSDEHGCAMADDYEGPPSEPADQYHSSGHDHEAGQESPKQGNCHVSPVLLKPATPAFMTLTATEHVALHPLISCFMT